MKTRIGFVSNSSSTSFYITNTSKENKTIVDFVLENTHLIQEFINEYGYEEDNSINLVNMVENAVDRNISFNPGEKQKCIFGDEQGDVIGRVYDYMLRGGGKSKSFTWKTDESLR